MCAVGYSPHVASGVVLSVCPRGVRRPYRVDVIVQVGAGF